MAKIDDVDQKKTREPYIKPAVKQLNPEEAKALLEEHAKKGDEGAKDLLRLISSRSDSAR
jgi:hypothetical protein